MFIFYEKMSTENPCLTFLFQSSIIQDPITIDSYVHVQAVTYYPNFFQRLDVNHPV